jgi:flagellin-specific chaperone FliS
MYQSPYRDQQYRQQEIMGASPIRLVIMAYDMAIRACDKKDFQTATKAISALRDALDFDYPDTSIGLFRLYQWCLECLRQGDFSGAAATLKELREAWSTAEKKLTTSSTAKVAAARPNMAQVAG